MFPFNYGFHWNLGTILFLGLFFAVVMIIGATIVASILRTRRTLRTRNIDAIRWENDFHDLPLSARVCRHELSGELKQRTCENEFDCRSCSVHKQFVAQRKVNSDELELPEYIYGFSLPVDRLYHRGHTWIQSHADGTYTVGLDDFAQHLMGKPDQIELPTTGTKLSLNSNAWTMKKNKSMLRILSPLDGKVVATGDGSDGWFLKIKPVAAEFNTQYLLNAHEAASWIRREFDRLQNLLADPKIGTTLADGGIPIQDFTAAYPKKNWDKIYCDMFLEA
jgi:glycine cleavage system H lipoate-binding protein